MIMFSDCSNPWWWTIFTDPQVSHTKDWLSVPRGSKNSSQSRILRFLTRAEARQLPLHPQYNFTCLFPTWMLKVYPGQMLSGWSIIPYTKRLLGFRSRHIPRLWIPSLVRAHMGDSWFIFSHSLALFLSLHPSLSQINTYILRWGLKN